MSPEQLLTPDQIDGRADGWSLAVAAYLALTGHMPFSAETYLELFEAIDRGRLRPPSQLRSDLPQAFDRFFQRAFANALDDRFGTVEELDEAFRAAARVAGAQAGVPLPRPSPRFLSDAPMAMDDDEAYSPPTRVRRPWARLALAAAAVASAFAVAMALLGYDGQLVTGAASGDVVAPVMSAASNAVYELPPVAEEEPALVAIPVAPVVTPPPSVTPPPPAARPWTAPAETRIDKIDDDPDHRAKPVAPSDNPYDDGQVAPKKAPVTVDDPGF